MKLIEALHILNAARAAELPAERYGLACGFTPLHLQTLLGAHLQQRRPGARVAVEVGQYGDLVGTVERAAESGGAAVAVVVEWSDLDARLGLRAAGGWLPAALEDVLATARASLDRIARGVAALAARTPVALAGPSLPLPPVSFTATWQAGAFELALRAAVAAFLAECAARPRVRVLAAQHLDLASPTGARLDAKSLLATGFPFTQPHADALAARLADALLPPPAKKGLISDLDDTFWSGILGEVGVAGVSWELDRRSHVHALYQQMLASLSAAGVLTAVASKNDAALVQEALAREDLLVERGRLFPVHASWGAKSEAVRSILRSWNVGADSVVFVDDSPMELAEVQAQFPEVECLLFRKDDPAAVLELLGTLRDRFGRAAVLDEDVLRAASLRDHAAAAEVLGGSGEAAEAFLSRAEAEVTLDFRKDPGDERPLQLLNKTNQFNLNGRRHTEAEWAERMARGDAFVLTVSYRDKFGALGKIAVVTGEARGGAVEVDGWVMSCRAFARRVEHQTLRALYEEFGADVVALDYRPTDRNGPLQEFVAAVAGGPPAPGRVELARAALDARGVALHHAVRRPAAEPAAHA